MLWGENELTKAVCDFLAYGESPYPLARTDVVLRRFGTPRGEALIQQIEDIIACALSVELPPDGALVQLGRRVQEILHKAYPRLGRRALKALAWHVTFSMR